MFDERHQEYRDSVGAIACEAATLPEGERSDYVHKAVDGSYWSRFEWSTRLVLAFSDNYEAGPDNLGWDGFVEVVEGWGQFLSRGAYFAMVADVFEEIPD